MPKIRVRPNANWRQYNKGSIYDIDEEPEVFACIETGMLTHIPYPALPPPVLGTQIPYPAMSLIAEGRSAPTPDLAEFSPAPPPGDATLSDT